MPRHIRWATFMLCLLGSVARAVDTTPLPRKTNNDEHYPGMSILYDAIRDSAGHRLRMIATHPEASPHNGTRFPVIYVIGWLSCDTVEAPPGSQDGSQRMFQALAQIPGFATVRLEKPGVGDSEGSCAATDFTTELAAYRQGFRHLKDYSFVDPQRIFLFGLSNGGGFAPLVPEGAVVRGYVVDGGWIKTWFEHMLEIERRRLALSGHAPAEMNSLMKSVERLYSAFLLERRSPREILSKAPELKAVWDGGDDQQYGRPFTYYQQLQDLDLMSAWSLVRVPVLALHGEYDWIMSSGDYELLVGLVNSRTPGNAELVTLSRTGHTFEHYATLQDAFAGKALPFDEGVARRVVNWFINHQR